MGRVLALVSDWWVDGEGFAKRYDFKATGAPLGPGSVKEPYV